MSIRVMTYNIQHCRDYKRSTKEKKDIIDYDLISGAIKSQNADIVVLNEVRNTGLHCGYRNQTKILARKAGYKYYKFGEAIKFGFLLPYGNGILSRFPMKTEVIKIPDPLVKNEKAYYETRCVIKAEIGIKAKKITILGSHFGLANSEKKNAVKTVTGLIDKCTTPCVLMGDFNMVPNDGKLKPVYDRLIDTAAYFEKPLLSFPSDKPKMKIDYIFVSKDIKVKYADIPETIASDHRMYICDIEI